MKLPRNALPSAVVAAGLAAAIAVPLDLAAGTFDFQTWPAAGRAPVAVTPVVQAPSAIERSVSAAVPVTDLGARRHAPAAAARVASPQRSRPLGRRVPASKPPVGRRLPLRRSHAHPTVAKPAPVVASLPQPPAGPPAALTPGAREATARLRPVEPADGPPAAAERALERAHAPLWALARAHGRS